MSGLYQYFSIFTILYACLWLLSLNSYSTATNCWLITCLFFLLRAVCANFISFSYSALFCAGQPSWNMPGMSYSFCSSSWLHSSSDHSLLSSFLYSSQYFICFFLNFFWFVAIVFLDLGVFFFQLLLLLLSRPYLTSFCIHPRICPCVAVPFLFSLNVLCRLCFPIIV